MVDPGDVEWKEVAFTEKNQGWTEYDLETGDILRMRSMAAKVEMGHDPASGERITLDNGEPLVRVKSSNFIEVGGGD